MRSRQLEQEAEESMQMQMLPPNLKGQVKEIHRRARPSREIHVVNDEHHIGWSSHYTGWTVYALCRRNVRSIESLLPCSRPVEQISVSLVQPQDLLRHNAMTWRRVDGGGLEERQGDTA